jgi:3-oxoadipate enol-lactonase
MSVELAHSVEGAGPAVVLASSLGTTREMFAAQRALLARDRTVISYDHRGHGGSPVPPGPYTVADLGGDVLALIDRLELDRVSFVGLSLGGMVGLWLAANAPERVERLIVICSSAYAGPPEPWAQRSAAVIAAGGTQTIADAVVARWFTPAFATSHPETIATAKRWLLASPAVGYAGCCAAIETLDLRPQLGEITAPTLVISAADDEALPPPQGRTIAAGIPAARFELLPRGAHIVTIEEEETVNALITEYLGDV